MRNWLFLLLIFFLGALQLTLLDIFRIFNLKPDLLLACVVIAALFFGFRRALFYSFCAGILKDALTPAALPFLNTFMFVSYCVLIARLSRKITLENDYLRAALVFIIALLNNLITGFAWVCLGKIVPAGIFLRTTLLASFYTLCAFPALLELTRYIYAKELSAQ